MMSTLSGRANGPSIRLERAFHDEDQFLMCWDRPVRVARGVVALVRGEQFDDRASERLLRWGAGQVGS